MLNMITVMGRLTRAPELRYTQNQLPVVSFAVACERDYAQTGEKKETDFIDCVAWRKTAEFIHQYFDKGQMIAVNGRLQMRPWTDRNGNKRVSAEIVVDHAYFGEAKRQGGGVAASAEDFSDFYVSDGDLPF